MIDIPGLTPFQRKMADRILAIESTEELLHFFHSLPRRHKPVAYTMFHMILANVLDEMEHDDMI
jgi:hypothetical protein